VEEAMELSKANEALSRALSEHAEIRLKIEEIKDSILKLNDLINEKETKLLAATLGGHISRIPGAPAKVLGDCLRLQPQKLRRIS